MPSLDEIRSRFPALRTPWTLLENAGGSQVPIDVADAIRDYMLGSYVQLGAGYPMSNVATETVDAAHAFANVLMNGTRTGTAILGPSSTQLCYLIAGCYASRWKSGDEIVLAETGHEANIGPWLRLEQAGAKIRWWKVDRDAMDCTLDGLDEVLSERTRIVAFPHVSNLLGAIIDVAEVTRRAHRAGARVFVDGVAYAPHRAIDVERWDVDWYVYSTYKVYGPHMGALYARADALGELEGPNHVFIPRDRVPYKFELGGACHEGCAAIVALGRYLNFLADRDESKPCDRATVERVFARMTELELPLQRRLIEGLGSNTHLRLVGSDASAANERVPTVSVLDTRRKPSEVVSAAHAAMVAIRYGHMYAFRLCEALGIDTTEGVVRVSAVHYNTPEEIERAIAALA
ncbi:MAG: aminotransferase class V-fold PLP-dependent enzyme [Phycisphaerae bacterium]|nr:aminotransferase class V-fold PLP-dependent enzyme [Phycisphaerae bacterium]